MSEWINVNIRTPNITNKAKNCSNFVLVLVSQEFSNTAKSISIARYRPILKSFGLDEWEFISSHDIGVDCNNEFYFVGINERDITHWMPLPSIPND
jgi:hypothetical protein